MGHHGKVISRDFWITKLNHEGQMEWQKCLGDANDESGGFIQQTADGGYILAGSSGGLNADVNSNLRGTDFWIAKLTSAGEIVWQKSFGGNNIDHAWAFTLTTDGGYIIAGDTQSTNIDVNGNHGEIDFLIVKVDLIGNLVWQKCLGGSGLDVANSVAATPDGGCVAVGTTESFDGDVTGNHGKRDFWAVKLSGTGNLQWQKCLGGSEFDEARSVKYTKSGGLIITGYTGSNNGDVSGNHQQLGGNRDVWVVKLNINGALEWQKCYGGQFEEVGYNVQEAPDGGYLVCGDATSSNGDLTCPNEGIDDMWVFKISETGILQWQKSFGGNSYDQASWVEPTTDGGCIIAAHTCSSTLGYHTTNSLGTCADFWIIKLSAPQATVVKIDPAVASVCANGNAVFKASAKYAGLRPVYQWKKNGIAAGTNSTTYNASGLTNNDVVSCTVTTGSECGNSSLSATDAVTVKVIIPTGTQSIQVSASQAGVCNSSTVSFTANVTNAGPSASYRWKVNGIAAGRDANIFQSSSLKIGDVITCEYRDNHSCSGFIQSNAVTISSGTISPTLTIAASKVAICIGEQVQFTATAINAGSNPSYQWKVNGVNVGTSLPVFTTAALNNNDAVSCFITSDPLFTCISTQTVASNKIQVSVNGKTNPSITVTSSAGSICIGEQVQFTATAINAGNNPTYHWNVNGVSVGTNQPVFTTAVLNNNDAVSCFITGDPLFTCISTQTVASNKIQVAVNAKTNPSITVSSSAGNCTGTAVTFAAKTTNAGKSPAYQWKINGVNAGNNDSVFTSNTLKNGDKVSCMLAVDPAYTCTSISSVSSNTIDMQQSIATITVTALSNSNAICEGETVSFKAVAANAGTNPTYSWKVNGKTAGVNSDTFSSVSLKNGDQVSCMLVPGAGGCSSSPVTSGNIVMNLYSLPVVSITPVDTLVAQNSRVQFQIVTTEPPANFIWSPPQLFMNPAALSPQTIPLTDNSSFTLRVMNVNGCETERKVNVFIYRPLMMPNAFTPNGDGLNDLFVIPLNVNLKLTEFVVYNRWGQIVFSTNAIGKGWDGTFRGMPAEQGFYNYFIKGTNERGVIRLNGTILLIR